MAKYTLFKRTDRNSDNYPNLSDRIDEAVDGLAKRIAKALRADTSNEQCAREMDRSFADLADHLKAMPRRRKPKDDEDGEDGVEENRRRADRNARAYVETANRTSKREETQMDDIVRVAKAGGLSAIVSSVIAKGHSYYSETEFSEAISSSAEADVLRRANPKLSKAQVFSRLYENDETIRKAHAIVAASARARNYDPHHKPKPIEKFPYESPTQPKVVFNDGAVSPNNPEKALDALNALLAEMKRSAPWLSGAELFERVVSDPKNRDLVGTARQSTRFRPPSPSYAFQRG
jgi:hypothetical protein